MTIQELLKLPTKELEALTAEDILAAMPDNIHEWRAPSLDKRQGKDRLDASKSKLMDDVAAMLRKKNLLK